MKVLVVIGLLLLTQFTLVNNCKAEGLNFTFKQGMLYLYENEEMRNVSCLELVKTKPKEEWGKWNMLWDGWSLDAGLSYDSNGVDGAALLIGRSFGTLGDYLPLEYPLLKKLTINLYPFGLFVKYPMDELEIQYVSGASYLAIEGKF